MVIATTEEEVDMVVVGEKEVVVEDMVGIHRVEVVAMVDTKVEEIGEVFVVVDTKVGEIAAAVVVEVAVVAGMVIGCALNQVVGI